MFYEPGKTPHNLPHDPFKACVAPRPIGWISTVDKQGCANLAPYSFFNAVCGNPPMVMFASGGSIDSLNNARETGEFIAAVAPRAMLREINFCSAPLPPEQDEFDYAGLEKEPGQTVAAHRIKGVPIHMECKVFQIVDLPGPTPQSKNAMVIGTVVGLHIDDAIICDGIKDQNGVPLTGLTNKLSVAKTEKPVDANGKELAQSVSVIDAEGIIRLSDGSYWIGEENGPSILHVAADGTVNERIVPAGSEKDFEGAAYKITGGLPAILVTRQTNRGIESMALSPDERKLYFMVQNPLANPNADAYKKAKNTRLFVYDRVKGELAGEYIYQLDDPQTFRNDPSDKQNAPRISEVMALGDDRLLVLERTDGTTKLHEVKLDGASNILASRWDDMSTSPSLEQENDLSKFDLKAVVKTLRFDSADYPMAPTKIEGLAVMGDGALALINDNDFGIKGDATKVLLIDGLVQADKF